MVPVALEPSPPKKRSYSDAGFDTFYPSKQRVKHHQLHWKQPDVKYEDSFCQDEETVQTVLSRSIGLALQAVGFERADPVALESFRLLTEEYMDHFLAGVRQSMLACRRTQPIAQDYLYALHACQLSLRTFLPHLDPPVSPSKSQVPLSRDEELKDRKKKETKGIEPLLKEGGDETSKTFLPQHFPSFPSKHTYKSTAQFTSREEDARKIREHATEEGRMGEEALRRLVGQHTSDVEAGFRSTSKAKKSLRKEREDKWKEAIEAVMRRGGATNQAAHDPGGMEIDGPIPQQRSEKVYLSSTVNADATYWRKPAVSKVRNLERME